MPHVARSNWRVCRRDQVGGRSSVAVPERIPTSSVARVSCLCGKGPPRTRGVGEHVGHPEPEKMVCATSQGLYCPTLHRRRKRHVLNIGAQERFCATPLGCGVPRTPCGTFCNSAGCLRRAEWQPVRGRGPRVTMPPPPPGWNELLIASFSHRSITVKDGILLATGLHVHRNSAHSAGVGAIFDRWGPRPGSWPLLSPEGVDVDIGGRGSRLCKSPCWGHPVRSGTSRSVSSGSLPRNPVRLGGLRLGVHRGL